MHPYQRQPRRAFWRRVVEDVHPLLITDWYTRKFPISGLRIAAAGSCFAQHIGRALRQSGFSFLDVEPAPSFVPRDQASLFGYGMYSARYGNVYTSRQLLQLLQRATGKMPHLPDHIWTKDNGYVDAFRPTLEPTPFQSIEELVDLRSSHLTAVVRLVKSAEVFVFTLGLTEAWLLKADGAAFPVCPGTAGGTFDPALHEFRNLTYPEIMRDMEEFFALARSINPALKLILTVSPVPLMATATTDNVITASSYSKSVLRSVAGDLCNKYDWVDYFPSFEIISSIPMRSQFYNADMRNVAMVGVDHVMKQFFKEHGMPDGLVPPVEEVPQVPSKDEIRCDEELLAQFGDAK